MRRRFGLLTIILLLSAGGWPVFGAVAWPANGAPIDLPKVVVSAEAGPREPWRVAETETYRIYSDGGDRLIRRFAHVLNESAYLAHAVWPGPLASPRRSKLTLILCDSNESFRRFVPAKVATQVDLDFVDRLAFGTDEDRVLVFSCSNRTNDRLERSLLRSYAQHALRAFIHPPPEWFVTGMAEIIAYAEVAPKKDGAVITYAQVARPSGSPPQMAPLPVYSTVHLTDDVRDLIDGSLDEKSLDNVYQDENEPTNDLPAERVSFSQYFFVYPYQQNLEDVLARKASVSPDEYRMTCWALVHMCAFGQRRSYASGLEKILHLYGETQTMTFDQLVRASFGISARSLGLSVASYSRSAFSTGTWKRVPLLAESAVSPRDLSRREITELRLRLYTLGGRKAEAEREQSQLTPAASATP